MFLKKSFSRNLESMRLRKERDWRERGGLGDDEITRGRQEVRHWAHNSVIVGSNPAPDTNFYFRFLFL